MAKLAEWPGASKIVQISYQQIMKNPAPMWFFVGVYTAITATSMLLQGSVSVFDKEYRSYADAIVLLFTLPLINYAFAVFSGKQMTINEFMQFSVKKLLLLIVTSLIIILITLGSILLLIVPAIWTIAWFVQAPYAMIDKNLNPIEALKESKRISKNHKGKVWGVIGISLVISLASSVVSVVPYVGTAAIAFATVVTTVTALNLYKWLQAASAQKSA